MPAAPAPQPGLPTGLEPGLRRLLAPNPSPMTHLGTNTYLVGTTGLAVIDPGPDLPAHMAAILAAVRPGQHISHIVVTHAHLDHSGLAPALSAATGAPVFGFGEAEAGRSPVMARLAATGLTGGEGVDHAFAVDHAIPDGTRIEGLGWALQALHTPGHMGNHLCLAWDDCLFTGDHVMGWASSLVSPPDGDMAAYRASLGRLRTDRWRRFFPGHGAPVADPAERVAFLLRHRADRETQILDALATGPLDLPSLTARIYTDTPPALLRAAARNVLAHLVDLKERNIVSAHPALLPDAFFTRLA